MDAQVVRTADGTAHLRVRRFDGTGLTPPAPAGTAALRTATRTLDVAGTAAGDLIRIRYRAGRVTVLVNEKPAQRFSVRDFDTMVVHGDAGNDAIDVRMAGVPKAIRVLGGAGNDTLLADHPDATLDVGADNDVLRGPGYLDGGPGDDVLVRHRRGIVVPAADD